MKKMTTVVLGMLPLALMAAGPVNKYQLKGDEKTVDKAALEGGK